MQVLKSPVLSKSRHALLVLFHASLLARASCDVGQTACLAPPRPHARAASARLRVGVEVGDRGEGQRPGLALSKSGLAVFAAAGSRVSTFSHGDVQIPILPAIPSSRQCAHRHTSYAPPAAAPAGCPTKPLSSGGSSCLRAFRGGTERALVNLAPWPLCSECRWLPLTNFSLQSPSSGHLQSTSHPQTLLGKSQAAAPAPRPSSGSEAVLSQECFSRLFFSRSLG